MLDINPKKRFSIFLNYCRYKINIENSIALNKNAIKRFKITICLVKKKIIKIKSKINSTKKIILKADLVN